jgi:hypothetical protein
VDFGGGHAVSITVSEPITDRPIDAEFVGTLVRMLLAMHLEQHSGRGGVLSLSGIGYEREQVDRIEFMKISRSQPEGDPSLISVTTKSGKHFVIDVRQRSGARNGTKEG